ncbi:MAG: T9SS type A sorting domain-containing protein [Bacteroides sp.]|nr:T9SS type A sorting domain-containing protein [Ruminococcus flavefaciens]MCM1555137.1 T9SS type A sorting domain-containing protein [Bacteroides sp.]
MKRKLSIILLLCVLSPNVWAGPGIVSGEEARVRVWSLFRYKETYCRNDQYCYGKDTVIGEHTYREVLWRASCDKKNEASAGYALREDDIRLYAYDYATQREYVIMDFSLKADDVWETDWIEETDNLKNPIYRVLAVGDTVISGNKFQYLDVYDVVHQVSDSWLTKVGSSSHGITWHRYFGSSLDTIENVFCVNGGKDYMGPAHACYLLNCVDHMHFYGGNGRLVFTEPMFSFPGTDKILSFKWTVGDTSVVWGLSFIDEGYKYGDGPFQIGGEEYMIGDSVHLFAEIVYSYYDLRGYPFPFIETSPSDLKKICATPTEKHQKAELILSPNPAGETITLTATGCNLQKVEILDVNGRILYAATLDNQTLFRYNVSWMPSGIYLARVKTPCGVLTEKFSVR